LFYPKSQVSACWHAGGKPRHTQIGKTNAVLHKLHRSRFPKERFLTPHSYQIQVLFYHDLWSKVLGKECYHNQKRLIYRRCLGEMEGVVLRGSVRSCNISQIVNVELLIPAIKSSTFSIGFRGISQLGSAFFFLRLFKLAHICIQVTPLHK